MEIIGFAVLGIIIFYGLLLAVIIGGAFGNKRVKNLREIVEQQRAAGITGDVTMNDDLDYGEHRHVHA